MRPRGGAPQFSCVDPYLFTARCWYLVYVLIFVVFGVRFALRAAPMNVVEEYDSYDSDDSFLELMEAVEVSKVASRRLLLLLLLLLFLYCGSYRYYCTL